MSEQTHFNKEAIIEAALMVSGHPLTLNALQQLFADHHDEVKTIEIKEILERLDEKYEDSGIELKEVASGFRFQARAELSPWLHKLWTERPPRYSRALLETLAIIAYKQPVTRAEIEEIRGVTVSTNIIKTLMEREWIKVMGVKDIPGKPSIYGTSKTFLDYFNLKSLKDLPTLAEFKEIATDDKDVQVQLALEESQVGPSDSENIPEENAGFISNEDNDDKDSSNEDADTTPASDDTTESANAANEEEEQSNIIEFQRSEDSDEEAENTNKDIDATNE